MPEHDPSEPTLPKHTSNSHQSSGTGQQQQIIESISKGSFSEWYQEKQFKTNILEGKAYFNGPSPPKDPDQHSPSKLLQCHRKASYARQNAPREGTPPEGLFWIGSTFEEEIAVPFLQSITPPDTYVTNSVWVDTELTVDDTTLRIRGSTDPAIVTADVDPLVVTEIKTTTSVEKLSEPKEHHKAQLHAYLYALNSTHNHDVTHGLLLYGGRTTFDVEVFTVEFDSEFWWETVVPWMQEQTQFEDVGELPPATPEQDWECSYCSFKHRCGEADTPYADVDHDGLLPAFTGYDRQPVEEYLDAHADRDARLTPTLAYHYPDLAAEYGVYDWSCPRCGTTYEWDAVEWDGDVSDLPFCPVCLDDGEMVVLSGPEPSNQLTQ